MPTSQLFEVEVGCTAPPPPRRISKLSQRYRCLKKNMPVIPVDANHPAASAGRRTVGERQHAPTRTSPPRVAKTKATLVMHNALAPAAARHPRDDSASFDGASFATATSATVGHLPYLWVAPVTVTIRRLMGGVAPLLGASPPA